MISASTTRPAGDRLIWIASLVFLALLAMAYRYDLWVIAALPVVLLFACFIRLRPSALLGMVVFFTPLSIQLDEIGRAGLGVYIPTEPLLFLLMVLVVIAQIYKGLIPKEIIRHPVSICFIVYLFWMAICTLFSTHPFISFKFLLVKLWFIIPVYFLGASLLWRSEQWERSMGYFLWPLLGVALYTTIRHAAHGFDDLAASGVMRPFFRDHTQYGAVVAFFIPIAAAMSFRPNQKPIKRFIWISAMILLIFSMITTTSRAALLSVVAALALWAVVRSGIHLRWVAAATAVAAIYLFMSWNVLIMELEQNRQDSSEDVLENVESVTNITTDASNLERLNRWNSALAMARVRPIFGFGPGTYSFEYAPFQRSADKTIISTDFGEVGNAHSEYLGPLSETGWPGMLSVLLLLFFVFQTAYQTYRRLEPGPVRHFVLFVTLALTTYFFHGILNNYLDSDKASVPVYLAMAILVAIDVKSRKSMNMELK